MLARDNARAEHAVSARGDDALARTKNISLDWLASGEGRQSTTDEEAPAGGMVVEVPVWNVTASSGPGSYNISEELQGNLEFSRARS